MVKLARRAAKFHLWLQARRQDLAAGGAKNQMEGQKKQKRGLIFKIQYWMYAATEGPNVKWRGHRFQMGGRAPLAPRWRRPCLVEHMELSPWLFLLLLVAFSVTPAVLILSNS